jgi:FkbM family methyltransferase
MLKATRKVLLGAVAAAREAAPPVLRRLVHDSRRSGIGVYSGDEVYAFDYADAVVGRQVALTGGFELWKLERALELCRRAGYRIDALLDVGANIGTTVIPALRRGWVERGIAVEPHPGNLRLLRANAALNGVELQVVAAAAMEDEGEVLLAECPDNSGDHHVSDTGLCVPAVRLDDVCTLRGPGLLVWMDVQGSEADALSGAREILASGAPITFELAPWHLGEEGIARVESMLADRDVIDLDSGHPIQSLQAFSQGLGPGVYADLLAFKCPGMTTPAA